MSQYGSHGRGLAGQNFLQILKTYYKGVDVGSYPITIGRDPGAGPPTLFQSFYAPNAQGTLVVRATPELEKLVVHVNDHDLMITGTDLINGVFTRDISPYLLPGVNSVKYNPVGRHGEATVNVNVY